MKLYLVRHATPLSKDEDPRRPLSGRGKIEAETIAAFLAGRGVEGVRSIFHSGKARAAETAGIVAGHLTPVVKPEEMDGLRPNDDPKCWIDRLAQRNEDMMLVGHLPNIERLLSLLVCAHADARIVEFPPAGAACLKRDDEGAWTIGWMIYPGILA